MIFSRALLTGPAVKAKINADVAKVIADPEIRARFDTFAFEPLAWSPEEIERNAEASRRCTASWCAGATSASNSAARALPSASPGS